MASPLILFFQGIRAMNSFFRVVFLVLCFWISACEAEVSKANQTASVWNITQDKFDNIIPILGYLPGKDDIFFINQEILLGKNQISKLIIHDSIEKTFSEFGSVTGNRIVSLEWSLSGRYIAYLDQLKDDFSGRKRDLYIVDVQKNSTKKLLGGLDFLPFLAWKGDEEVFYSTISTDYKPTIESININSEESRAVLKGENQGSYFVHDYIEKTGELFFSSEERTDSGFGIVFYKTTLDDRKKNPISKIIPDKSIFNEGGFSVSRDGLYIAFSGYAVGEERRGQNIFVASTKNGNFLKILDDDQENMTPVFSPDTSEIIFYSQARDSNGNIKKIKFSPKLFGRE
jgi:Tol biopolymer transport system component